MIWLLVSFTLFENFYFTTAQELYHNCACNYKIPLWHISRAIRHDWCHIYSEAYSHTFCFMGVDNSILWVSLFCLCLPHDWCHIHSEAHSHTFYFMGVDNSILWVSLFCLCLRHDWCHIHSEAYSQTFCFMGVDNSILWVSFFCLCLICWCYILTLPA